MARVVALEGVLLVAAVMYIRMGALPDTARFFPYAVVAAGILMSWRFRRSRLLFGLLVLALADRALVYLATGFVGAASAAFHAVGVLLPANMASLALVEERGTLTRTGLRRLALIAVQVPLVALLCCPEPVGAAALLSVSVLPKGWFAWTPLAQPALAAFAAALLVLVIRLLRRPNATGRGFLWALVASFLALNLGGGGPQATMYFSTGGLILVVSVIEASYFMAFRDGLTALPTRRALGDALLRLQGHYSVAMVDVDRFKTVNDDYGHEVGDQVLRMVATEINRVGGGGRAFRYGGEEFAILFSGKGAEAVVPHLERLRKAVEEAKFTLRGSTRPIEKPETPLPTPSPGRQLSVTVSIGVAERADRRSAPSEALGLADEALYRAKQAGRNRVKM